MKGRLEVLEAGLLTTVQDGGRVGFRKYGIPVSGVMDEHACKLANWLVGNSKKAPVLEMTLQGGKFKFHTEAIIGVSGAEAVAQVNGKNTSLNKTIHIKAGEVFTIGRMKTGCRIYVAIRGDWQIKKIMGSYSTCLAAEFGGYNGRSLQKGDVISWVAPDDDIEIKEVPKNLIPLFSSRQRIRIIPGPEWERLTEAQQTKFLQTDFSISTQSNRMGIRLSSSSPFHPKKPDIKSSPVVPGIIQLPQDGNPIILMKDAQSVGGYPRIAKVADADLWRLGQAWPPVQVRFDQISVTEAKKLSAFQEKLL